MKADLKCGTTDLLQSMQKGSVEAELPIFGNEGSVSGEADLQIFGSQDRAKVQKRNCKSLDVQAEMKCGSGTSHLWKSWQNKCGKRNFRTFASKGRAEAREQNFTYLAIKAERKVGCGSGTSHFWQSVQNESADVELQIFASQGRAEMWKRNIRSLAVKAEQKCGSGILDL